MTTGDWIEVSLEVNGRKEMVRCPSSATLLELLRVHLSLVGTKEGCGEGECGACSVFLDGRIVDSCLVAAIQADGRRVTTIEGLDRDGVLHPMQQAFIDEGAVQCGFCIPGMLMAAVDLVRRNPCAGAEAVKRHLAGNLCRCTGYGKILEAVMAVEKRVREEGIVP